MRENHRHECSFKDRTNLFWTQHGDRPWLFNWYLKFWIFESLKIGRNKFQNEFFYFQETSGVYEKTEYNCKNTCCLICVQTLKSLPWEKPSFTVLKDNFTLFMRISVFFQLLFFSNLSRFKSVLGSFLHSWRKSDPETCITHPNSKFWVRPFCPCGLGWTSFDSRSQKT